MRKLSKYCFRCGNYKDESKFNLKDAWWCRWCDKCKSTPVGEIPKQ